MAAPLVLASGRTFTPVAAFTMVASLPAALVSELVSGVVGVEGVLESGSSGMVPGSVLSVPSESVLPGSVSVPGSTGVSTPGWGVTGSVGCLSLRSRNISSPAITRISTISTGVSRLKLRLCLARRTPRPFPSFKISSSSQKGQYL